MRFSDEFRIRLGYVLNIQRRASEGYLQMSCGYGRYGPLAFRWTRNSRLGVLDSGRVWTRSF
jgi:hypothetical protein